jgi:hypothetical protein
MTVRTTWLLNPGQTRADTRLGAAGTWTPTDATQTRAGVVPGGTALNLTGSTMTGTVAIGRAVIQGTSTQGAYGLAVTAAETFTVANGHASLNRIDSVFAVVYDSAYDTSGLTQGAIVYVQGTASASPTAPTSVPNSTAYLKLWDIAVAAGSSAGSPINWATALTDQRTYTVAVGGINPGGSSVAGAYAGQWRDGGGSAGILERYNGSAWEQAVRLGNSGLVSLGDVSLTRSGSATAQVNGSLNVTGTLSVTGVGARLFARKTVDQQVINSTTLVDDADLQFTVAASGVYVVRGLLGGTGSTTGDLKIGWVGPVGSTFDWTPSTQNNAATSTVGSLITDRSNLATSQAPGMVGASIMTTIVNGLLVVGGSSGTFKLQFAQNTADAGTASIMKASSYLVLERVA